LDDPVEQTQMARRKSGGDEPRKAGLTTSREEAGQAIGTRIAEGRKLLELQVQSGDELRQARRAYEKWDSFNTDLLGRIFTTNEYAEEYSYAFPSESLVIGYDEPSLGEQAQGIVQNVEAKLAALESIVERLALISAPQAAVSASSAQRPATEQTNKVFVVHGHDEASKANLEVFLTEIGLDPIVLHRQADQGLTVIEKFEKHSDVGYAFVLLTPDEVAYLAADEVKPDGERKKERRARPNVIFEFGYFVGKLGRSRVCCLYRGGVTLPSDVGGMIYKRYSETIGEVAYDITKDLRAAGYRLR
jgi:predicted nucleotide-binding protein